MIKPKRLSMGDKVAVVSLSWGGLGDDGLTHKFDIAKEQLGKDLCEVEGYYFLTKNYIYTNC